MEKRKDDEKICITCDHCIYIGEGDYICDADDNPIIVMEEFSPNDNYWHCAGSEWESDDDE